MSNEIILIKDTLTWVPDILKPRFIKEVLDRYYDTYKGELPSSHEIVRGIEYGVTLSIAGYYETNGQNIQHYEEVFECITETNYNAYSDMINHYYDDCLSDVENLLDLLRMSFCYYDDGDNHYVRETLTHYTKEVW